MPTQLREAARVARKAHACSLCVGVIAVGDKHHVSTNVWDGRVYDWRTCIACATDGIIHEVYDWAGQPDEGVGEDTAQEWAHEARRAGPSHPKVVQMAEAFLRRRACNCESCEETNHA